MMPKLYLKFSEEFTECPGAGLKRYGDHSAEDFMDLLIPIMNEAIENNRKLIIDLNDIYGMPFTFSRELGKQLVIRYPYNQIISTLELKCEEDPSIVRDWMKYIQEYYNIINDRESIYININETCTETKSDSKTIIKRIIPTDKFIELIYDAIINHKNLIVFEEQINSQVRINFRNILIILTRMFNVGDILEHIFIKSNDIKFINSMNKFRRNL